MNIIDEVSSDLNYAYRRLQSQVEPLSEQEMESVVIDPENRYTVKECLAHLAGWQDYVLEILPAMLSAVETRLPAANPQGRIEQAIHSRSEQSGRAILAEIEENQSRILKSLQTASAQDLTMRRLMGEKVFTIKSYVIDLTRDEILKTAEGIDAWRTSRSQTP